MADDNWLNDLLDEVATDEIIDEGLMYEHLRKLDSNFPEIAEAFVSRNGIGICKYILEHYENERILRYTIRIVSKISSESEKFYRYMIKGGMITDLVRVMEKSESRKVKIAAARVLAFLVNDATIYKEFINAGAISALVSQLQISGELLLQETTKALSHLSKIEQVAVKLVDQGILLQLIDILVHSDITNLKIKENGTQLISRLLKFPDNLPNIQKDLRSLVSALVEQLKNQADHKIRKMTIRVLSKLAHFYPELPHILYKQKAEMKKMNLKNCHIMYIKISPSIDIDYDASSTSEESSIIEKIEKTKKKKKKAHKKGKGNKGKNFPVNLLNDKLDYLGIVNKIVLYELEETDLQLIEEQEFLSLFPLIVAYVRDMSKTLNEYPESLMASVFKKRWKGIVTVVTERIHSNQKLGYLACWLEERKLGLEAHYKKKYAPDPESMYNVKGFYKSQQFSKAKEFFCSLGEQITSLSKGDVINYIDVLNPLNRDNTIVSAEVLTIFSSKAKPILLSVQEDKGDETSMIFKKGGDTRKDMLIQVVFKIFNSLWEKSPFNKEDRPYIYRYEIVPLAGKYSCVEFIPGCDSASTYRWKKLQFMRRNDFNKFLTTAAGSYIASWIMGIRDRHQDNMLIRDDIVFFNIDFEHIFNQKTKFNDAPRFAIHSEMRSQLVKLGEWERFKTICAEGFTVIQNHSSMIIHICSLLFDPVYKDVNSSVRSFLTESLMVGRSPRASAESIKVLCEKGASSLFKTIKFMAHDLAIQQRASARNTAKSSDELVENSKSKRLVTNISEFLAEDNEKLSQLIEQSRHTEKRHSEKRSKRRSRRKKHKHHRENSFSVRITVSDEETEDIPMGGTFPISRRSLSPREVEEQQSHDVLTPLPEIVIQKQSRMRRDTVTRQMTLENPE
eukprot:TRINITY_DN2231_c0_g1_i3.p1 TRINITY_DN2231_c0_g1~~TRINITY_DN2231_c0_g1_i3.p1  ORF type:complete len:903 (-),score=176.24 TRINITY_DN2231_c0_g1_i3:103-2811(-)